MDRAFVGLLVLLSFCFQARAVRPDLKKLPIGLTTHEARVGFDGREVSLAPGPAPFQGKIHSLGEWEESVEVLSLWPNASYMKALSENGKVRLLADTESDKNWWKNWILQQKLNPQQFSFFIVPTDSIWVRDYGPWPILDGRGNFGLVDTIYNRPRPQDDRVPDFIGQTLNIPVYKIGLIHTGGNYYSDGLGNAFSSTLVFSENSKLSQQEVHQRMFNFLGITRYSTSKLSPQITIEHLDTFGKLVAPDTWVFSEFPSNSVHYEDSEKMVELLKTLTSPYGTPYKIFRLQMIPVPGQKSEVYRAYINSFISNGVLYFPTYGDDVDALAASIYQKALPGYKIVGVQNGNTEWGDSVHCRSRNLIQSDTMFVFPNLEADSLRADKQILVKAEVYPSPGAEIKKVILSWKLNSGAYQDLIMDLNSSNQFVANLPPQVSGSKLSLFIRAEDSRGKIKMAPIKAPEMTIEAVIRD